MNKKEFLAYTTLVISAALATITLLFIINSSRVIDYQTTPILKDSSYLLTYVPASTQHSIDKAAI